MQDKPDVQLLLRRKDALISHDDALSRELRETRRSIMDINEQLNSTLPINSLPTELLLEVFGLVQGEPWTCDSPGRRVYSSWLPIQAVCRYWRQVIRSDPHTGSWRTIEVYSRLEWLQVCLMRCADAHADITLHVKSLDGETLSVLSQYTSVIRSLIIVGNLDVARRTVVASWLTAHHWLVLEQLVVTCAFYSSMPSQSPVNIGLTIENAPSLRVLRLEDDVLHPPAEHSLYPQLSSLDLRFCEWQVSFSQFLNILECMTNLKVLHLEKTFLHMVGVPETRPPEGSAASHARIVTLPRLRSLVLASNQYRSTTQILDILCLPTITSVRLLLDEHGAGTIAAALPRDQSLTFPLLSAITSVVVSAYEDDNWYSLLGRSTNHSHGFSAQIYQPSHAANVFQGDWAGLLSRALADFVDVFSHSPITELLVAAYSDASVAAWVDVFERFPGLENINLRGCEADTAHRFWVALGQTPPSQYGAVFCPRLKLVDTVPSHTFPASEEYWTMPRVLRDRKERGHMLQELRSYRGDNPWQLDNESLPAYWEEVKQCVGVLED